MSVEIGNILLKKGESRCSRAQKDVRMAVVEV